MSDKKYEVEMRFQFTKEVEEKISKISELISYTTFQDSYFDSENYELTKNNNWLRKRDSNFELKIATADSQRGGVCSFKEISEIPIIQNELAKMLRVDMNLKDMTNQGVLLPYSSFRSFRRKYKFNEFTFDFDETDFGYRVGEVEIMVNNEFVHQAREKVEKLFKSLNLQKSNTNGKVIEYIKMKNPKHFSILKKMIL